MFPLENLARKGLIQVRFLREIMQKTESSHACLTFRHAQNGSHFQINFPNEKHCILIKISLKIAPGSPMDHKEVSIGSDISWLWTGNKPLLEPMLFKMSDTKWHYYSRSQNR